MKHKFPILQLCLSVIFLIFSCSVFTFLYFKVKNNDDQARQSLADWQVEANKQSDLASVSRSLQAIDSERALLATHFIQSSNVVPFLDMIEKLAPEAGAKATVTNVSTNNAELSVEVKATGTFPSLYKFLTLLENSPYEIIFDSADMQSPDTTNTGAKNTASAWSADFTIELLSFVQ